MEKEIIYDHDPSKTCFHDFQNGRSCDYCGARNLDKVRKPSFCADYVIHAGKVRGEFENQWTFLYRDTEGKIFIDYLSTIKEPEKEIRDYVTWKLSKCQPWEEIRKNQLLKKNIARADAGVKFISLGEMAKEIDKLKKEIKVIKAEFDYVDSPKNRLREAWGF